MDSNDAAALLDAHPEAIGVHDHPAGPVLVTAPTSTGTARRGFSMLEWADPSGMLRATPARVHKPLRLRVCLSYDGPPWLSLLAQCAWLRGGIIGERVGHQPTS